MSESRADFIDRQNRTREARLREDKEKFRLEIEKQTEEFLARGNDVKKLSHNERPIKFRHYNNRGIQK